MSSTTSMPGLRRLVYCSAMLSMAMAGLVAVEPLRRAEPLIGRRVADMFVFSVLKNNPERLVPPQADFPVRLDRKAER